MEKLRPIFMILVIIGALNWGLALFNINLVTMLFGTGVLVKVVYGLVGASGLVLLLDMFSNK